MRSRPHAAVAHVCVEVRLAQTQASVLGNRDTSASPLVPNAARELELLVSYALPPHRKSRYAAERRGVALSLLLL
jgi:hypothetical protein